MAMESTANGTGYVSLDEALAGAAQAPPLDSEFTILLVGVLKHNAADDGSEDATSFRLYPADGRDDRYYTISKADVDRDRVELVSQEVVAARGWIADKVHRIRVRPSAQVFSVRTSLVEASRLNDECMVVDICRHGLPCGQGYVCGDNAAGVRVCKKGAIEVPCPDCV
jgi:hypothetical protein